MKCLIGAAVFLMLGLSPGMAASEGFVVATCPASLGGNAYTAGQYGAVSVDINGNQCTTQAAPNTASVTNPTSTLTLPATTTNYSVGNLIANSATAGSVVVPSFAIANSAGAVQLCGGVLTSNDSTSTAWGAATIQIDFWRVAPTFTNGNLGAYAVATGSAAYIGSATVVLSPVAGDGVYGRFTPTVGNCFSPKLASGTSIFWTLQAITGSGTLGASKVFTITPELVN